MPNFECVNSVRYKKHSKKRGLAADGPGRDETRKKRRAEEKAGKGKGTMTEVRSPSLRLGYWRVTESSAAGVATGRYEQSLSPN